MLPAFEAAFLVRLRACNINQLPRLDVQDAQVSQLGFIRSTTRTYLLAAHRQFFTHQVMCMMLVAPVCRARLVTIPELSKLASNQLGLPRQQNPLETKKSGGDQQS